MDLPALLELRLSTILESPTERRFYQNVHSYLDLIMKNDVGRLMIKRAERDYSTNHADLWREKYVSASHQGTEKAQIFRPGLFLYLGAR